MDFSARSYVQEFLVVLFIPEGRAKLPNVASIVLGNESAWPICDISQNGTAWHIEEASSKGFSL